MFIQRNKAMIDGNNKLVFNCLRLSRLPQSYNCFVCCMQESRRLHAYNHASIANGFNKTTTRLIGIVPGDDALLAKLDALCKEIATIDALILYIAALNNPCVAVQSL